MSFISLLSILAIGIIIASLITNTIKGVVLFISGVGISYYLFLATPEQRVSLDQFAATVSFTEIPDVKIDATGTLNEISNETKKVFSEKMKELKIIK